MGVALLSAASLSKTDKQTVQDWMVEGHSIMNGKIEGTIPDKADYSVAIAPGESIALSKGYYNGAGVIKGSAPKKVGSGTATKNFDVTSITDNYADLTVDNFLCVPTVVTTPQPNVSYSDWRVYSTLASRNASWSMNYNTNGTLTVTITTPSVTIRLTDGANIHNNVTYGSVSYDVYLI